MDDIVKEFAEIRRVSDPLVYVNTTDYRETLKRLAKVRTPAEKAREIPVPTIEYNTNIGHRSYANAERQMTVLGEPEDTVGSVFNMLYCMSKPVQRPDGTIDAEELEIMRRTIFFVIVPDPEALMAPNVGQAIANLRDPFKGTNRTLVLLGSGVEIPPIVESDVTQLDDPLPDDELLAEIRQGIQNSMPDLEFEQDDLDRCVYHVRGMTAFSAESALARKMRRKEPGSNKGVVDFPGLARMKRSSIFTASDGALRIDESTETFDDIGGMVALKNFHERLLGGPDPYDVIVWMDEIEKAIGSNATGAGGDNTGVSQDQLMVLLNAMQEYKWTGQLLVGGPGTGKSLASKATGNTFNRDTIVFDLGATKGSLVGQSERKIRDCVKILRSMGRDKVFFFASCNRLDTLPPELLRRFSMGIWYCDTPNEDGRKAIWDIHRNKFNIPTADETPDDLGWVGSDIYNCCRMAYKLQLPLQDAANMITLSSVASRKEILALRETALQRGFLSTDYPGRYRNQPAEVGNGRAIQMN